MISILPCSLYRFIHATWANSFSLITGFLANWGSCWWFVGLFALKTLQFLLKNRLNLKLLHFFNDWSCIFPRWNHKKLFLENCLLWSKIDWSMETTNLNFGKKLSEKLFFRKIFSMWKIFLGRSPDPLRLPWLHLRFFANYQQIYLPKNHFLLDSLKLHPNLFTFEDIF